MTFSNLAKYYEQLEATSKRLELIDILSKLFKESNSEEIGKICYLIQGRVAPFFEATELGMAESLVAQAIGKAYGFDKDEVIKVYRRRGNMGLVAQELAEKVKVKVKSGESVAEVFNNLRKIAEFSGDGTVEKKVTALADILQNVDPISAKHLVNIPLGTLRLGIGDPTVMDSLSIAKTGDKKLRPVIEDAYNKTSDLGYVAERFFKHGAKGLEEIKLIVGKPVRPALAERTPSADEAVKRLGDNFAAEPKFDGFRCIGGLTPIYVKDKGLVSIKDAKVGDLVLSHTGEFKKVIANSVRQINKGERLFNIYSYFGQTIKISEGHEVLIRRKGQINWIPVEKVQKADQFVFPIPKLGRNQVLSKKLVLQSKSGYKKTFNFNNNFFRFVGFWIGDGFTNAFHNTERVGLTFNALTEKPLAEFYRSLIKKEFQISEISEYTHNGGLSIYWRDGPFRHWLSENFRRNPDGERREWAGKMIPSWFANITKSQFDQFLKGWIESDGTSRNGGGFKITTKERDLAMFCQILALSFKEMIGVKRFNVMSKTYYELNIPGTAHLVRVDDNNFYVSIQKIEEIKKPDPRLRLFNLQVEGDESYCTPLIALHNCQIHKTNNDVNIFSRNLEDTTLAFPDLVSGAKLEIKAKSCILEGEAIAFNPLTEEFLPFQETTKRRRKYNIEEKAKELPLVLFAFDLLFLNGRDITEKPYLERRKLLEGILPKEGKIMRIAEERVLHSAPQIMEFFNEAISEGLEGLMLKKLDAPYKAGGRGFHWIKFKRGQSGELNDTIDCVLLGVYSGKGKRTEFGVGGLLVGVYNSKKDVFETISRIGTGLTDDEFRKVFEMAKDLRLTHKSARVLSKIEPSFWVEPKVVMEVFADEITKSPIHTAGERDGVGYALRFPRVIRFREEEKRAEDTTTVEEIEKMYEQQYVKKK